MESEYDTRIDCKGKSSISNRGQKKENEKKSRTAQSSKPVMKTKDTPGGVKNMGGGESRKVSKCY